MGILGKFDLWVGKTSSFCLSCFMSLCLEGKQNWSQRNGETLKGVAAQLVQDISPGTIESQINIILDRLACKIKKRQTESLGGRTQNISEPGIDKHDEEDDESDKTDKERRPNVPLRRYKRFKCSAKRGFFLSFLLSNAGLSLNGPVHAKTWKITYPGLFKLSRKSHHQIHIHWDGFNEQSVSVPSQKNMAAKVVKGNNA